MFSLAKCKYQWIQPLRFHFWASNVLKHTEEKLVIKYSFQFVFSRITLMDVSFLHRYRDDRARPRSLLKKARGKASEKVNYVLTFPESAGNSCFVDQTIHHIWFNTSSVTVSVKLWRCFLILDVIAAATLGFSVLQQVLTELGSVKRKIAIGISNKSGMKWQAINARLKHGTSDQVLPYQILSGKINVNNWVWKPFF